jgi:hypothetical protein
MRLLVPLARRPRARAILRLVAGADQALWAVGALGRYDGPEVARALGWDADAVAERGRLLRREEGRP